MERVKECILAAAEVVCPEKKNIFSNISLSRATVARRTEDMAADIEDTLNKKAQDFVAFSLCLDETTDEGDTSQCAIFVRGVDSNFNVTEEMLKLSSRRVLLQVKICSVK